VRSLERAIDLDPRNSFTLQQIALSYRHLRRFAEENRFLDRALAIEPDDLDTNSSAQQWISIGKLILARCIE